MLYFKEKNSRVDIVADSDFIPIASTVMMVLEKGKRGFIEVKAFIGKRPFIFNL
jgi:hypothetical protein